jgi:hypothetical protein
MPSKRSIRITLANPKRIQYNSSTEDESMFIHNVTIRRKLWHPKGIRPVVTVTGSHQRTCVFGSLTLKGRQLFRQYSMFNQQDTFLDYLKEVNKRLGKIVMCTDRACQHQSKKVQEYLTDAKD